MIVIALLLLVVGLTKLYLVTVSNKMELKELVYHTPVIVDVSPDAFKALLTMDGLVCTFGGIALLCLW